MPNRSSKRPRDTNQLAKLIVDIATGSVENVSTDTQLSQNDGKDPAAVALGRKGGLKGGKASANKLMPEQRATIAKKQPNREGLTHEPQTRLLLLRHGENVVQRFQLRRVRFQ